MTSFHTSVRVARPIEEVFAFVSDPRFFPEWNSAVEAVQHIFGEPSQLGSTYAMRRQLPTGPVDNQLEIVGREHPTEFRVRTTSGPTPFTYSYRFDSDGVDTVVYLEATVELQGVAPMAKPLAARAVRRGVDANFAALKRTLEASTSPK
jgi:uncharacterized protein YndB with AHSA1/START domain